MLWVAIGALLVMAVGAALWLRADSRRPSGAATNMATKAATKAATLLDAPVHAPARAVTKKPTPPSWGKRLVVEKTDACQTARILAGQCFPNDQIPTLPLKGCGNAACRCVFEPVAERRSGDERRSGSERRDQIRFEDDKDRRTGKSRRKDEHYTWHSTI